MIVTSRFTFISPARHGNSFFDPVLACLDDVLLYDKSHILPNCHPQLPILITIRDPLTWYASFFSYTLEKKGFYYRNYISYRRFFLFFRFLFSAKFYSSFSKNISLLKSVFRVNNLTNNFDLLHDYFCHMLYLDSRLNFNEFPISLYISNHNLIFNSLFDSSPFLEALKRYTIFTIDINSHDKCSKLTNFLKQIGYNNHIVSNISILCLNFDSLPLHNSSTKISPLVLHPSSLEKKFYNKLRDYHV